MANGTDPDTASLWDAAALLLPYWAGIALLAVVIFAMLGLLGKGAGAFHLFRDDDEVFGRNTDFFDGAGEFQCRAVPRFGAPRPGAAEGDAPPAPTGVELVLASPAFWSGAGLAASVGLLWMLMFTGPAPVPGATALWLGPGPEAGGLGLLIAALAGSTLGSGAISRRHMRQPRSDRRDWSRLRKWAEPGRAVLGGVAGGLAVLLGLYLSVHLLAPMLLGTGMSPPLAIWLALALPWGLGVAWVFRRPNALACVSIFTLVLALLLVFGLIAAVAAAVDMPRGGAVLVLLGLVGWLTATNGARQKYRLPGFAALYTDTDREAAQDGHQGRSGELVAPLEALKAWHANLRPDPGRKPILVLLATSGGAYRASFWTALLMDRLIGESGPDGACPGLADHIRVLTGASGGMVAAGYFAVLAAERRLHEGVTATLIRDTHDSLALGCARKFPIGRDSLSPIVHQMVRGDLWHSFLPRTPRTDRGQVLERQWRSIHFQGADPDKGNLTFADLRPREANGTAPSLIFSPMLVETGALALMSNLDLGTLRQRSTRLIDTPEAAMDSSVEVFKQFAGAQQSVAIAQAARLSATFPYMSPAISLPTDPDRRVVDAGYYDNYGIDLATGLLQDPEIADWIKEHCAGVAVIEARAFPSPLPTPPAGRLARALQFLTSPPEALFSARQASQMFRNHQQLHAAARLYDRDFLRVFTFEAVSDVSMSWYLRFDEVAALARLLEPLDGAHAAAMERAKAWLGTSPGRLMTALQTAKGEARVDARRHQITLQRHVVDAELRALKAFWQDPTQPDPRCCAAPSDPVRRRAPDYPPNWFVAAQVAAAPPKQAQPTPSA